MAGSDTYTVERRRHLDAPPGPIRERIVDLHRWQSWSPWEDLDPDMQRTYGGPEAGVGAWYAWKGNRKAGQGRMEIVDATGTSVAMDLQFIKPFRSESTVRFDLEPDEGGTEVVWTLTGPRTLMTRVMGLFTSMDKMVGPDFERGLERLQADVEAAADST